ncbi:MAG: glycoside hydrolase, partial [Spirochaetales bacterium]|nr:glycoside hydrolase [Spirochaetales bacterium]
MRSTEGTLYFEQPRPLATDGARFPHFLALPDALVIIYQDSEATGEEEGEVFLSLQTSPDGREWRSLSRRVGPFSYAGSAEPYLFSAAVGGDGAIYVAVTASAEETVILRSVDGGESFATVHRVSTERANVAPRLFVTSDGSILLFVNQNLDGRQQIVYLVSEDGEAWSEPAQLEPDEEVGLTFLPSHTSVGGRDYVVYQGLNITARSTYQLYLKTSDDGGRSWSETRRVTTFVDPTQTDDADLYDNQRPYVASVPGGDSFVLTWERRFQTGSQQVYLLGLNRDGLPDGLLEEVTGRFD